MRIASSNHQPTHIQTRIPGKLFITGEYAILKKGQSAILTSVDQYLTCDIESNDMHTIILESDFLDLNPLELTIDEIPEGVLVDTNQTWRPAFTALQIAREYLELQDVPLRPMTIRITSDMTASHGKKYGLGSSGAVIVAVILAVIKFHGLALKDHLQLYKLAVVASKRAGSNGSMADIATITHGQWVVYRNFDHAWLESMMNDYPIAVILEAEWPLLQIQTITPPANWQMLVGWTGLPASTQSLVQQLLQEYQITPQAYDDFQVKVEGYVTHIFDAMITSDFMMFQKYIALNHQALALLGQAYHLPIETPQLKALVDIAYAFQGAAKLSGAGGGDCGLCFFENPTVQDIKGIQHTWTSQGILYLPFSIAPTIPL